MELTTVAVKVPDVGRFDIPVAKNTSTLLPDQKLIMLEKVDDAQKVPEPSTKGKGKGPASKPAKSAKTN